MRKFVSRATCIALLVILAAILFNSTGDGKFGPNVSAQTGVQFLQIAGNLNSPVYVTSAHDGSKRLFIVEQPGRILVMPPGSAAPLSTPLLDIRTKVAFGGERGLLGLAFHPLFNSNRRFFVNYTRSGDGATVVSEFQVSAANPNVADTAEKIIFTTAQPFSNHNGGMIEFGPDGYLYIGMGDGGSANDPGNRAQNVDEVLGKMLRIDIDNASNGLPYASPSTNPYFGATAGRDEIYAIGLRNPWRWSFDRATGQLYAGDVGQGDREEVDIITLGGNYGWRVMEGTKCTNLGPASCAAGVYIPPIAEYDHSNNRCSITGGYVYRGTRSSLPAGSYIYGDYCTGEIFLYNNGASSLLRDTDMQLASFGEDEAGEIYAVDLGGRVFRIAVPAQAATVSAANYKGSPVATESIAAGFGSGFSTTTESAPAGQPLPTTLAGATVRVKDAAGNDRAAPLFFVSPTQLNYQVPPGTSSGDATITFTNTNGAIAVETTRISNVAPGLFSADSSGKGIAAAVILRVRNGNQSFESMVRFDQGQFVTIPIDLGPETDQVYLVVFGTGFRYRSSLTAVTATIGGTASSVTFAGAQGSLVGLDQSNILIPRSLINRGDVDVVMKIDTQDTNMLRINMK